MTHPPHLPPPSSSISLYRRVKWTLLLLGVIIFSFVSAIAATLATIAWIVPVGNAPQTLVFRDVIARDRDEETVAGQEFVHEETERLLRIVDDRKKIADDFYPEEAAVGTGVILTDDGWFVMLLSESSSGALTYWKAIDHKEDVFPLEEIVIDADAGLLYGKAHDGARFRVASFADPKLFARGVSLYGAALQNGPITTEWPRVILTEPEPVVPIDQSVSMTRERYRFGISETLPVGTPLFSKDRSFAGFQDTEGRLLSVFFVTHQYTNVFQNKEVSYATFPFRGRLITDLASRPAFLVTHAPTRPTKTSIGPGDIITKINNASIDPIRLHEQILTSPAAVELMIVRSGETITILVDKKEG